MPGKRNKQINEKHTRKLSQCNALSIYSFIGTISKKLALMDRKEKIDFSLFYKLGGGRGEFIFPVIVAEKWTN